MWALVERIRGRSPSLSPHLPAISSLAVAANHPEWVSLDIMDVPIHQRSLSIVIDEAVYSHLLSTAPDIRSRALVLSSSLVHAEDWLNVVPSASLGLHIHDQEFHYSLRYWLGVPLYGSALQCPECWLQADVMCDHQVGCGGNDDRLPVIRDVFFSACQSAALGPRKEASGIIPNSSAHPANILLSNYWSWD